MHEATLRAFFRGHASAAELRQDIEGAAAPRGHGVTGYSISDMGSDFEVTAPHLTRLCRAVMEGELPAQMLEAVGNCLMFSERFHWDSETEASGRVSAVAHCWAVPVANYPLTAANARKFERWLLTGENRLEASPGAV